MPMSGVPTARDEDQAGILGARGEFIASLPRRIEGLRSALSALLELPADDGERQNALLRRLHALASSARVLEFASVADALTEAENALRRMRPGQPAPAVAEVSRALDVLPSLVLGAPAERPTSIPDALRPPSGARTFPISVLVLGPPGLAHMLARADSAQFEAEQTDDLVRARELLRVTGPDAALVDGDLRGAREFLEQLGRDPLVAPLPVVVVGDFRTPDAATAFIAAGANRILPKPVNPETLARTLSELREAGERPRVAREPLGELSIDQLAERIAEEFRRGLTESLDQGSAASRVQFGEGADVLGAIWGAVARVRELSTLRSQGSIRFKAVGPEGAIPLAPWSSDQRRAGDRGGRAPSNDDDVRLKGRRVVVVDDDPAVVWFLSGLLKAVGAEVIEAHDGDRALSKVFENHPDLVVSDVLMPGLDGFALCHEIKRDVAVRDVPVILLSWKEDLLQRMRELGADADGYLQKEASASTVVERIREVLRPRARVEQRLAAGGEVRGRLDGLTPRLLLELLGGAAPDSTLTIRDAVYLYEANLRGGRLKSVTRSSSEGSFERGPRVLAGLLGVSAGRFVVQRDSSPCRGEFDAPLAELLAIPVRHARAALAAVSAASLAGLKHLKLDGPAVRAYLTATPSSAAKLVERLLGGESPRELLLSGASSAGWLENVLSDLARRGAILEFDVDSSIVPKASRQAESPRTEAPAAPSVARTEAPSQSAPEPTIEPPPRVSFPELSRPPAPSLEDWGKNPLESGDARKLPAVAAVSRPSRPELDDVNDLFADLTDPSADHFAPSQADSNPAAANQNMRSQGSDHAAVTRLGLGPDDPGRESSLPRPGIRPVLSIPEGPPKASPSMADVFAAALRESPNDSLAVESPVPPPVSDPVRTQTLQAVRLPERDESSAELIGAWSATPPPPAPATEAAPTTLLLDNPSGARPAAGAPEGAAGRARAPDNQADGPEPAPIGKTLVSASLPEAKSDSERSSARRLAAKVPSSAPGSKPPSSKPSSKSSAKVGTEATDSSAGSGVRTVILACVAFLTAFLLVNSVLVPLLAPKEAREPATTVAEPANPAPDSVVVTERLPMPAGVTTTPGSGLLEVEFAATEELQVNGQVQGRGPVRMVPLPVGKHTVRVLRGDAGREVHIEVSEGQRTRVSFDRASKSP
ncbi:MAG TPA: response regulator [Polyangiaceae bacterium]|nr:response regulator [Polyangiaceae bacterium]